MNLNIVPSGPPATQQQGQGFVQMPGGYPAAQPAPAQGGPPMPQMMQQFAPSAGPVGAPPEPGSVPMPVPVPQQQGQPAQPAAQPSQTDATARLVGPAVPPELQGKTVAEAMQIYNGMRQVVTQMVPGPMQPALPTLRAPLPAPGMIANQPPTPQPAQPAQPAQQPQWDWRNPEKAIADVVGQQLDQRLAPLMAREVTNGIMAAKQQMIAEFGPVWGQLAPLVEQRLVGADPAAMQNPQIWRVATEAVVGQLTMQAAAQGRIPGTPQPQAGPTTAPPQTQVPGQQPMPNLQGFFTEAPTTGAPVSAVSQLSTQQDWVRQQMGMSVDEYVAWSGGRR